MRARGGARARARPRFAPGIEKDVSRARKDARDRGRRAWDTHLFRGEVGVSEPNQDSQERVVRPFVVAVDFAYALEEAVPPPMVGWFGSACVRAGGREGQDGGPCLAARVSRRDPRPRRSGPGRSRESKNEGKGRDRCLRFGFVSSEPRARAFARGGGRAAPRGARKNRRSRLSRDARGRAGRRRTFCSSSFTCCSALNLYGCGDGWETRSA